MPTPAKTFFYHVLGAADIKALEKAIDEDIEKGYRPAGGICVQGAWFYQAMTMDKK